MHSSLGRRRGLGVALVGVFALVIGTLGLAGPASAAGVHNVTITATGNDVAGNGDLTVELYSSSTTYDRSQQTNSAGQVVFRDVPEGANYVAYVYDNRTDDAYDSAQSAAPFTVGNGDVAQSIALTKHFRCSGVSRASGSTAVGNTLTATGTVAVNQTPTSTSYEWYRVTVDNTGTGVDFTSIQSGNSPTYTLTPYDVGSQIVVQTYYRSATGSTSCGKYAPTGAVGLTSAPPTISGKAKVGKKLTANAGAVPAGTAVSYQWFRAKKKGNFVAIAGANGVQYKLKGKDRGKKVAVAVTYSAPGAAAQAVLSASKKVK